MSKRAKYVIVSTTTGGSAEARRLAAAIVESRLGACVQIVPILSVYRWKGRVESAKESLLLVKTRAVLAAKVVQFIRGRHSYETPEVLVLPVAGGLGAYLDWIDKSTGAAGRTAAGRSR